MTATIVDGKGIASAVLNNLKAQVGALGVPIHLAAVCVGNDPALRSFVLLKQKAAQSVGIEFSAYFLEDHEKERAAQTLQYLAQDESVDGIFIELPLPAGWDSDELIALIPADKDADALTAEPLVPAPPVRALGYILDEYDIRPRGMRIAVVGQGRLVGVPIARWLCECGADVATVDISTPDPAAITRTADMVITGAGTPGLVTGDWIKDDAIVVDYGYGKNKKGAVVGDVDFSSVAPKAKLITPVPGGMGPLVIAAVLENLLSLAQR